MYKVILGLIILFFLSCGHSKRDFVTVDFRTIESTNELGLSQDLTVKYFPIELFQDTTLLKTYSYMYYKMNEAILHSHYLRKDVYRLTSIRSNYKSPFVVTIEKYEDSVVLITKELNRRVDYPFIKNPGPVVFVAFINSRSKFARKEEVQRFTRQKILEDSIAKIYRNCNYHLVLNKRIRISKAIWDSLEILVDSAKFWKSKPEVDLSRTEDDDSRMIFEGHSKNGYQIRIIPSLHLYKGRNIKAHGDNYDSKNDYTKIIRFVMRQTTLRDNDIY